MKFTCDRLTNPYYFDVCFLTSSFADIFNKTTAYVVMTEEKRGHFVNSLFSKRIYIYIYIGENYLITQIRLAGIYLHVLQSEISISGFKYMPKLTGQISLSSKLRAYIATCRTASTIWIMRHHSLQIWIWKSGTSSCYSCASVYATVYAGSYKRDSHRFHWLNTYR